MLCSSSGQNSKRYSQGIPLVETCRVKKEAPRRKSVPSPRDVKHSPHGANHRPPAFLPLISKELAPYINDESFWDSRGESENDTDKEYSTDDIRKMKAEQAQQKRRAYTKTLWVTAQRPSMWADQIEAMKKRQNELERIRDTQAKRLQELEKQDTEHSRTCRQLAAKVAELQKDLERHRFLEREHRKEQQDLMKELDALKLRERAHEKQLEKANNAIRGRTETKINRHRIERPSSAAPTFQASHSRKKTAADAEMLKSSKAQGADLDRQLHPRPSSVDQRWQPLLGRDQLHTNTNQGKFLGQGNAFKESLDYLSQSQANHNNEIPSYENTSRHGTVSTSSSHSLMRTNSPIDVDPMQDWLARESALQAEVERLQAQMGRLKELMPNDSAALIEGIFEDLDSHDVAVLRKELWRRTKSLNHAVNCCRTLECQVAELQEALVAQEEEVEQLAQHLQQFYRTKFTELQLDMDSFISQHEADRREDMRMRANLLAVIADLRNMLQKTHHRLACQISKASLQKPRDDKNDVDDDKSDAPNDAEEAAVDVQGNLPEQKSPPAVSLLSDHDDYKLFYSRLNHFAAHAPPDDTPAPPDDTPVHQGAQSCFVPHVEPKFELIYSRSSPDLLEHLDTILAKSSPPIRIHDPMQLHPKNLFKGDPSKSNTRSTQHLFSSDSNESLLEPAVQPVIPWAADRHESYSDVGSPQDAKPRPSDDFLISASSSPSTAPSPSKVDNLTQALEDDFQLIYSRSAPNLLSERLDGFLSHNTDGDADNSGTADSLSSEHKWPPPSDMPGDDDDFQLIYCRPPPRLVDEVVTFQLVGEDDTAAPMNDAMAASGNRPAAPLTHDNMMDDSIEVPAILVSHSLPNASFVSNPHHQEPSDTSSPEHMRNVIAATTHTLTALPQHAPDLHAFLTADSPEAVHRGTGARSRYSMETTASEQSVVWMLEPPDRCKAPPYMTFPTPNSGHLAPPVLHRSLSTSSSVMSHEDTMKF